eukprot:27073_1
MMMSWLYSILFYIATTFLIITVYFMWNEFYMYHKSWPLRSYDEMISIAKRKKDHEMNDEEFDMKYAPFRHEMGRLSVLNQNILKKLNIILHFIELYVLNGGPSMLKKKYPTIKKPIFIIGDFRSGTSVLERLIAHHPDITYFTMTHGILWSAPYLWMKILSLMDFIRYIFKHESWNSPWSTGIYWPHSSNVLLTRDKPFEIEMLWESCKFNLKYKRYTNWDNLNDIKNNPDNNCNIDILDETLSDKQFEILFMNSIRLLLATNKISKSPRFILKNPLNGYRINYLYKLFPDAQFIHIARNPLKTTLSQIRMAQTSLRCFFLNENECRINNNYKTPVFNDKNPNNESGMLWFPRQFPRTIPEYYQITKYLKNNKYECAVATSVCQFERVVLTSFKKSGINYSKQNLETIWHEDMLENAELTFEKVMKYLNLACTKKQRLEWLEKEDFPSGQANQSRIEQSQKNDKNIIFGKHTKDVTDIIESSDAMKRYKQRKLI